MPEKFGNFDAHDSENPQESDLIGLETVVSFDELYNLLLAIGAIQGTSRTYSPEYLKREIERVRHGHRSLISITRSHGLRDVVERLLVDDPVYKKYVLDKQ